MERVVWCVVVAAPLEEQALCGVAGLAAELGDQVAGVAVLVLPLFDAATVFVGKQCFDVGDVRDDCVAQICVSGEVVGRVHREVELADAEAE